MASGCVTESVVYASESISRLAKVFNANKDTLKKNNPSVYYAILDVLDSNKVPTPMGDYFTGGETK